jgi:hypothetical protein
MSSSGNTAINSGPLIVRTALDQSASNTYVLGQYDFPVSSNCILTTSTGGLLVPSNNVQVSTINISTLLANGSSGSAGQVLTSGGPNSSTFWSTVQSGGGGDIYWTANGNNIQNSNTGNVTVNSTLIASTISTNLIQTTNGVINDLTLISTNQILGVKASSIYYTPNDPFFVDAFKIELSGANFNVYKSSLNGGNATFIQNNGGGPLVLKTNNPTIFINGSANGNNNVGIGTSTPQYTLDVSGSANITSTLTVSTISSTQVITSLSVRAGADDSGYKSIFSRIASGDIIKTVDYEVTSDARGFGFGGWQDARYVYNSADSTLTIAQVWGILLSTNANPNIGTDIGDIRFFQNVNVTGNVTVNNTLSTLTIRDINGSPGTNGQVLTAGIGGQVVWGTGGGGGPVVTTISTTGIYTLNTFVSPSVQYVKLVIEACGGGGGGGGGNGGNDNAHYGGGGGGSGYLGTFESVFSTITQFNITIGQGGNGINIASEQAPTNGGSTLVANIVTVDSRVPTTSTIFLGVGGGQAGDSMSGVGGAGYFGGGGGASINVAGPGSIGGNGYITAYNGQQGDADPINTGTGLGGSGGGAYINNGGSNISNTAAGGGGGGSLGGRGGGSAGTATSGIFGGGGGGTAWLGDSGPDGAGGNGGNGYVILTMYPL